MRRCPRTAGAAFYSIGSFNFICLYPAVILGCSILGSFNFICLYPALPCFSQTVDVISTGCNAALVPKESELPCFPLIQDKTFIAGTDSTLFVFIRLHWFIQLYFSLSSVALLLSGSGCYIDRMQCSSCSERVRVTLLPSYSRQDFHCRD